MKNNPHRRPAIALMITVLVLTLLIAVTADLTTLASTAALSNVRQRNALHHQLAVESALVLVHEQWSAANKDSLLRRSFELSGRAESQFDVGSVQVRVLLQSDAVKLHPGRWAAQVQQHLLHRKLSALQLRYALPGRLHLRPIQGGTAKVLLFQWYDQMVTDLHPGGCFPIAFADPAERTWSERVTFWGDGRLDLRFVEADVLEIALEDIRPGLAGTMLARRADDPSRFGIQAALDSVPTEFRGAVAQRVAMNVPRFSLILETAIGADRRMWYIVAGFGGDRVEIHHRGQITW